MQLQAVINFHSAKQFSRKDLQSSDGQFYELRFITVVCCKQNHQIKTDELSTQHKSNLAPMVFAVT